MNPFNVRGVTFAIKTSTAAIVAILLALSLHLPNPGWAVLTVFLTSQQFGGMSGAVVSRAIYRVLGTLLAATGILFFIPALMGTPELLIVGVAAWVALCLYVSLLDRSPRGYVFLLAAYTLPLIGMPLVNAPASVFDTTVLRVEEILLGAAVSMAVHTVFAPRSVRPTLVAKATATLNDAENWISKGLHFNLTGDDERRARERFGADLAELHNLSALLDFEPGVARRDIGMVAALEERFLALLPLLAGIEERLAAIRAADEALAARLDTQLAEVRRHVGQPLDGTDAPSLPTSQSLFAGDHEWLLTGATERLAELIDAWDACRLLLRGLEDPTGEPDERVRALVAQAAPRTLHVDPGVAALSGLAAAIAVMLAGGLCWVLGWDQGAAGVGLSAVASSLFAFLDDPRPFQKVMLRVSFLAVPVAALYVFAILPALDGPVALTLALAPLFFASSLYLAMPQWAVPAIGFILVTMTLMSVQPLQAGDFGSFVAIAVATISGVAIALVVTSLVRTIGAETSVRRLLRAAWRDLAAIGEGKRDLSRAGFASHMMDRMSLLQTRMPFTSGVMRTRAMRALDDMRLGVNMLDLRDAGDSASSDVRSAIEGALEQTAAHFRHRLHRAETAPTSPVMQSIDHAIAGLAASGNSPGRSKGLAAASGLRLGLFPASHAGSIANGETP